MKNRLHVLGHAFFVDALSGDGAAGQMLEMDPGFLTAFNAALSGGIQSLEEQLPLLKRPFADVTTITEYLKRHIRYEFGEAQKKGLSLFLSMIK